MDNINFNEPNFFIRLNVETEEENIFIYSDIQGISYLQRKLNQSDFQHVLSVEEVLKKQLDRLINNPTLNSNKMTGIDTIKWCHKNVFIEYTQVEELNSKIQEWIKEVKSLLGKDNVHIVYLHPEHFKRVNNDEYSLVKTLESIRLSKRLDIELKENQTTIKPKL